jgi:DNA-binding transcriptional LysR family regulator
MKSKNPLAVRQGEWRRPDATGGIDRKEITDQVFFALSNHRRRFVLDHLHRDRNPCEVRELVEALAAWENGIESSQTTSIQRKRAYVSLRQTHLPTLADLDLIDYDPDRGVVDTGDRWELVGEYLPEPPLGVQVSRSEVAILLGLAVLGLAIALLSFSII